MKALFLLLASSAATFARIGETKTQCIERYGVVYEESADGGRVLFRSKGVDVLCFFKKDGKVWGISFARIPKTPTDPESSVEGDGFSDAQVKLLLEANGNGSKWTLVSKEEYPGSRFETADGQIFALNNDQGLWIETKERVLEMRRRRTEDFVDQAIKGF